MLDLRTFCKGCGFPICRPNLLCDLQVCKYIFFSLQILYILRKFKFVHNKIVKRLPLRLFLDRIVQYIFCKNVRTCDFRINHINCGFAITDWYTKNICGFAIVEEPKNLGICDLWTEKKMLAVHTELVLIGFGRESWRGRPETKSSYSLLLWPEGAVGGGNREGIYEISHVFVKIASV